MFTKAFYQQVTHFFQVSLKVHCLKWLGNFVYNKIIQIKAILFIISLLFVVYHFNRFFSPLKIEFGVKKSEIEILGPITQL